MNRHDYSIDVKTTLEQDIRKCLIDTEHITSNHTIVLHTQLVGMYPHLSYKGTFQVKLEENITLGEFQAAVTSYGLTHWNSRPLYNLRISYDGESIFNKGKLFNTGYVRVPLFNP